MHGGRSQCLGIDFVNSMAMVHAFEHPIALTVQMAHVILNGVFDLFPKLTVAYLEAGAGWVPYMKDRLGQKYQGDRRRRSIVLKQLPSEYIRSGDIYFSCELDEKTLDVVVRELGEDVLVYPSDFPHEKARGEFALDIPEFLKREDLSKRAKKKILCDYTNRVYRL